MSPLCGGPFSFGTHSPEKNQSWNAAFTYSRPTSSALGAGKAGAAEFSSAVPAIRIAGAGRIFAHIPTVSNRVPALAPKARQAGAEQCRSRMRCWCQDYLGAEPWPKMS
jgi:hypothetical protein